MKERHHTHKIEDPSDGMINGGYLDEVELMYQNINMTPIGGSYMVGCSLEKRTNAGSEILFPCILTVYTSIMGKNMFY